MTTIKTNNVPRTLIDGYELTAEQREEFDYLDNDELDQASFFKYKGQYYNLGEVVGNPAEDEYDGHIATSYFSAILVKIVDCDTVIIASQYS